MPDCTVKESSFVFYTRAVLRLLAFPELANQQLSKIKPEIISRFAANPKDQNISISAINGDLRVLRCLLRLAFEWELVSRLPVVHELPGERVRDRVISFKEEQKYLAAAGPNLRALMILAVDSGRRPHSELFIYSRMAASSTGYRRVHATRINKGEGGEDEECGKNPATDGTGKRRSACSADRSPEEAMAVSWPGEFRASDEYSKIPSTSDSKGWLGSIPILQLAAHLRNPMR